VSIGDYINQAKALISQEIELPQGYALAFSGQYEYMERAKQKLSYVIPATIAIIIILLYASFRSFIHAVFVLGTVPFALIGGIWLLYIESFNFSVAVGVGFIALAGVAVEIGIIMLSYLESKYKDIVLNANMTQQEKLKILQNAVIQASQRRIRPVMMTSTSIIFGLLPVLYGSGTGSEVMSRIAAPMVGGMISALLLSLFVLPLIYYLWRSKTIKGY